MTLRLHAFLPRSRANGPGWRSVVWVQGCSLGCPECFNPLTHDRDAEGVTVEMAEMMRSILVAGTEGLTISGGEPLQQAGVWSLPANKLSMTSCSSGFCTEPKPRAY